PGRVPAALPAAPAAPDARPPRHRVAVARRARPTTGAQAPARARSAARCTRPARPPARVPAPPVRRAAPDPGPRSWRQELVAAPGRTHDHAPRRGRRLDATRRRLGLRRGRDGGAGGASAVGERGREEAFALAAKGGVQIVRHRAGWREAVGEVAEALVVHALELDRKVRESAVVAGGESV